MTFVTVHDALAAFEELKTSIVDGKRSPCRLIFLHPPRYFFWDEHIAHLKRMPIMDACARRTGSLVSVACVPHDFGRVLDVFQAWGITFRTVLYVCADESSAIVTEWTTNIIWMLVMGQIGPGTYPPPVTLLPQIKLPQCQKNTSGSVSICFGSALVKSFPQLSPKLSIFCTESIPGFDHHLPLPNTAADINQSSTSAFPLTLALPLPSRKRGAYNKVNCGLCEACLHPRWKKRCMSISHLQTPF